MERLHMNYLRDLIHRVRSGESDRRIARDLGISRTTVRKYREWADTQGYLQLDRPIPDDATLAAALGPGPQPPRAASSVEPYREIVQRLLDQGVEMTAIWQRLQDDHSYTGSYSSVRRYVHRLRPSEPEAVVQVHTAPGEEAQVGFGSAGKLYDPSSGRVRTAYVFDQKIPTRIGLHRRAFESWGGAPKRVVPEITSKRQWQKPWCTLRCWVKPTGAWPSTTALSSARPGPVVHGTRAKWKVGCIT